VIRQIRNAPQSVQNVVTYDAVIDVDNPDLKLRPGMTANVTFTYAEKDDALKFPNAALRFRPPAEIAAAAPRPERDRRLVWVLRDGKPKPVAIRTGLSDGSVTEVAEGTCARATRSSPRRSAPPGTTCRPLSGGRCSGPAMAGAPLLRLEDVTKIYRAGEVEVRALAGVSLVVETGEFVAIMGASGSGKSTLMHLIGCLDRPTSGRYLLEGREVSGLNRNALAEVRNRTMGFVFQSFNLLARTSAVENVELPLVYAGVPAAERKRRAAEALRQVGLGDRLEHQPGQMSGGQQQRVAIARALVGAPRLLLADEPTGNLDSRTSGEVMALLRGLSEAGLTVVLVTHAPDIATWTSRVLQLKDGLVVSDERQAPVPVGQPAPAGAIEVRS